MCRGSNMTRLLTALCSAFTVIAWADAAGATDIDLQRYSCKDFIADIKDPRDGEKLLRSMMMISWSTGYAAAYQKKQVRADPIALRLIASTLGVSCAQSPDRNVVDVVGRSNRQIHQRKGTIGCDREIG